MAITVNHSTPADASFSATGAAAWDANHTLSGLGTMAEQNANNVAITGGTITGVSGIGTVTGVTGTAPVVSSGGTAPAISMAKATTLVDGYLSATDWNTFNNKQPAGSYLTAVTANAPLSGSGTSGSHLIISQATTSTDGYLSSTDWNTFNNKGSGTVTSVTGTAPVVSSGGATPAISMAAATTSVNGYLTSTDWTTFNGKQAALVSGTNIKTINGNSLLGSGDITVSASAGGSNTQVQYNSTGALAGSSSFTWDGTTLKVTNLETTSGVLADGSFGGTYLDGIVVDYDTVGAVGRISVGGADGLNFYNGGIAGSLLGAVTNNGDWSLARFLDVGNGSLVGGATNPIIAAAGSATGYVQMYIHNDNSGTSASSDIAAYPDNGTDASGWIDMGITSSTYNDSAYLITGANEGYIFMSAPSGAGKSGNLVYATDSTGTSNAHQWYSGGFNAAKNSWEMQLNSTGLALNVPLTSNVTTGTAPFVVASTTQVANLNAATAGTATTATNATNVANTGAVSTAAAFYPTFVAANTTSNQGVNTAAGLSFNPSTGVLSSTAHALAAGTASVAPLSFTSGTNLTTAAAGAMEYDGTVPYFSIAASTRGAVPTEQWVVLTGTNTLTSQTGVQPIFDGGGGPTNGAVTLPVGTYQFECSYALTGMSATTQTFGFGLGGAATKTFTYNAQAAKGTATALATANPTTSTFNTAANTALTANGVGTVGIAFIKGIIRVTVAGTVIPQVSLGVAAAAIVQAGSYFRVSPIGNATVATVGNWS